MNNSNQSNNTIYIDIDDIVFAKVVKRHRVASIEKKHITKKTFLGLTIRDERDVFHLSNDYTYSFKTFDEALYSTHASFNEINRWVYYTRDTSSYFEVDGNDVYVKTCVILQTKKNGHRLKFFDDDASAHEYLKNLGVLDKLRGLDYDI